ncbi:Reverse transcriptase, partial [Phytophthora palmivora]
MEIISQTNRVCKPGLLAVEATVKGFEKPWIVLIDSGASGNYVRRSTVEGSQLYAEALRARASDVVTVRLATGTRVTVPMVPLDLGVKFIDFDSRERCLVLDLDSRYDLILGMAWLERHEPWIDWKSKTLGATHFSPDGALASHEPTSARTQKRYCLEHWTESVSLLDVGVSELVNACVGDTSPELRATLTTSAGPGRSSLDECGVARNPLGGVGLTRDASPRVQVDAVGNEPRFHGLRPDENCEVARTPLSSTRPDGKLLRAPSATLYTSDEVSSVSSEDALRDCSEQLYTLVNGVTGEVDGDISLSDLPTVDALLKLDEMSMCELGDTLKAGGLAEVVLIRPAEELNSSSLVDEEVLEDTKQALNARSGSAILKDPSDPFHSLLLEYEDVVSKTPPMDLCGE